MAPPNASSHIFPLRSGDALADFHLHVASEMPGTLWRFGKALARDFGDAHVHACIRGLLYGPEPQEVNAGSAEKFDRLGWRLFLEQIASQEYDFVDRTQLWWDAAAYASQGIAPREPPDFTPVESREVRVRALLAAAQDMIAHGGLLFAFPEREVWEGVMARGALDFGGQAPAKGVQMLSGVSIAAVRNAVSAGELPTNAEGFIEAEAARDWLSRRRDFCASRWRDTADDQYPFTPEKAVTSDAQGNILVPHDGDGVPFIPKYVARPTRGRTGLSFTVGAKGAERQYSDFYEALHALAHMDVPRWRRRNSVGNWGIVRARGAWTAVSREDLQDQIAQTLSREG